MRFFSFSVILKINFEPFITKFKSQIKDLNFLIFLIGFIFYLLANMQLDMKKIWAIYPCINFFYYSFILASLDFYILFYGPKYNTKKGKLR
jgi:hypothetical protein